MKARFFQRTAVNFTKTLLVVFIFGFVIVISARAHESRPAYLELTETAPGAYDVFWKVPARGDLRLAIYVGFPADAEVPKNPVGLMVGDAYVERYSVKYESGLEGQAVSISGLESTKTDVLVRFTNMDGITQTLRLTPDAPEFVVAASSSGGQVALTYFGLGWEHILLGIDHLLFVLALVLLVKGWKRLVGTVTAFTVAHSITLAAATLGFVHVPGPPVEACIALSIVFVAAEILHSRAGRPGITERWPWLVAFIFGLLHGLGFAGALSEVGLPQHAIPVALLFFNVGVEIGQLTFIAVVLAVGALLKFVPVPEVRWTPQLLPYAIGSVAMFWVVERVMGFL